MVKKNDNLIGVIGDLHMKDSLSYAEFIPDGRASEKKEVLDFIVETLKDCKHIVFMGDNFNARNNSSETNREFVEFLERFKDKEVYVISGNHEKKGNGKTAIDFLREVDHPNWHIFTHPGLYAHPHSGMIFEFLPYMLKSELEVETNEEAAKKIVSGLEGADILFAHHTFTGTSFNGIKAETFQEPVLNKDKAEKKYKLIVAGHIHSPMSYGKTFLTGSVFTDTVGEEEKFIYKIKEDLTIQTFKVPGRPICKLENPFADELYGIPENSIVKVIVTDRKGDLDSLKEMLKMFDASILIEDYPNSRKKVHIKEGAFDFSIEALLKLYSEEKSVDYQKLLLGLELIK